MGIDSPKKLGDLSIVSKGNTSVYTREDFVRLREKLINSPPKQENMNIND